MSEAAEAPRPPLRRGRTLLVVFAGLLIALGAVAAIVYLRSERALERRHVRPPTVGQAILPISAPDPGLLERGRHLVTVVAQCTYCHGPDLGGREMADDPWIGRLHAANLTRGRGGIGERYSASDWEAALRGGQDPDGLSLLLMPSAHLARLTDRDLAAIVAYLEQVPPIDRVAPPRRVGWLTRVVVALDLAPDLLSAEQGTRIADQGAGKSAPPSTLAAQTAIAETIPAAPTVAYGEYLVELGSCRVCHRADLAGGVHPLSLPGEPVPPDLTPRGRLAAWGRDDFARAMRDGQTPDGRRLDRAFMPWPAFAALSELEIDALWAYLRSLEGGAEAPAGGDARLARRMDGGPRG